MSKKNMEETSHEELTDNDLRDAVGGARYVFPSYPSLSDLRDRLRFSDAFVKFGDPHVERPLFPSAINTFRS
jgi:hypothetical protein